MTLGDNVVRFSPDGSYFTTNGILGLENSVRQVYGTAESHTCGVWARPASLPGTGLDADVFRITDDRPLGRFGAFFFHRNEIRIGLLEDGAGTVNWTYTITASFGSPPDTMIVVGTTPVEVGKWYHILACKNDTYSARLFINGVSETLETVGVPPSNANTRSTAAVGFDSSPASDWIAPDHPHGPFDGDVHSAALWNIAISEEAVRSVYSGGWKDLDLRDDRNPGYNDAVNLVHWWRFGQGATDAHPEGNEFMTDWVDSGGISITEQEGVVEQSDILKVGEAPAGTSVDFDGTSSMSTPTAVPIGVVNEWTVSAWIKPREVLTTDSDIIYIGPDSSGADSILISQNGDTANDPLVVAVKDTAGTTIFAHEYHTVLSEDEWQHVAATWDGASLNTYLDGELLTPDVIGAGAGTSQANSSRDIFIGAGPGDINPWNGKMGHVGVWHEALSPEDIRTVYAKGQQLDLRYDVDGYSSGETLECYFKPGEDSTLLGRNFIDMNRSAAARVLTLITGDPIPVGDSPTSPFVAPAQGESRSVSLDGVSELFAHTTDLLIGIEDTWSVSLWANKTQVLADRQLLHIWQTPGGTDNVISLEAIGSADLECIIRDSVGAIIKQYTWLDVFPFLNVWKNLVITWNGTSLLLYIDGVETLAAIWTVDNSGTMTDTNRSIIYGAADHTGPSINPWPGYLGHLGIWNTVLAAGETVEITNNGHALDLGTDFGSYVSSASLLHYWRPGFADVGFTDEQASPASIDFDDSVNLDASDIVDEAP